MSLLNRVQQLPKGFVWGAATAAYQTEGSTKVAGKGVTHNFFRKLTTA